MAEHRPNLADLKFETLQVEKQGNVLNVWLNRPEKRNAWNFRMDHEVEHMVVHYAEDDPDIKVIVVRGRGKTFCSGHDLDEVAAGYAATGIPSGYDIHQRPGPNKMWYCSKPVIVGIHGYVGPGAVAFLADIDFVIAAEGTRLSFEQARMGAGTTGATPLLFHFPPKVWKKLIMMGGWMTAEQALGYDFVQRVVTPDQLDAEVDKWAREICKVPLKQLQAQKTNVHRQWEMMGFLTAYAQGPKDGHGSAEDMAWFRKVAEQGLTAALKDRDQSFDEGVSQV
jgi:enoyl-CoA hydratase